MGELNATFWDNAFAADEYRYGTEPNAFLAEQAPKLLKACARVLCIGDGEGRNGVWLAEQGYDVHILEPSGVGIRKALSLAQKREVTVKTTQGFFPATRPNGTFDAVVLIYLHQPADRRVPFHEAVVSVLNPGGVVILEGFDVVQRDNNRRSGGPPVREMLFTTEMLAADFADANIEHLVAEETTLREGPGHDGAADVVRLVARRPAS